MADEIELCKSHRRTTITSSIDGSGGKIAVNFNPVTKADGNKKEQKTEKIFR